AVVEALRHYNVQAQIFYGPCAWIEVLEDHSVIWSGTWGDSHGFWVGTQFGEVVDLNVSVSHRKLSHSYPDVRPLYAPPMLWAREDPNFYCYRPEGLAEIELTGKRDRDWFDIVRKELAENCVISELPTR